MSNSIWKTPDVKPDRNNPIIIKCVNGAIMSSPGGLWGHNVRDGDRWAYLHEVVAQADKAERLEKENKAMREEFEVWHGNYKCEVDEKEWLQKQLDRAKWWLKEIVENHRYTPITTAEMALKELDNDK